MRWPILLTLCLSVCAIGIEQSQVVAQVFPGLARACGGCGNCRGCRPRLFPPIFCNRCQRNDCSCPPAYVPPTPCAPVCAAPVVPQMTMRMQPRRVASWEMVPQTRCRRVAECVQVPVTTYKRVVSYVPQTVIRNKVCYRNVAEQVMVPRRRVSTVWEPRCVRSFAPVCPPVVPQGCTDFGGYDPNMIYNNPGTTYQGIQTPGSQPTLTVPSAPQMDQKVPTPADFDQQSMFSPWSPVQQRNPNPYYQADAYSDGYRTITNPTRTASGNYPGSNYSW
ncbi:hypothetical protein [Rubinisphaera italica]|uniref:Uncharacterized protein n=1 Tax=Rubinisphaera italica TaxID=2527969 RepID=A0A5C5XIA3_9PLAN|nr:hypothetical protein [Rubinisphaera italica]TWT62449.1 hypothetical protein Pan54_31910 [Rubinisphaera italica]